MILVRYLGCHWTLRGLHNRSPTGLSLSPSLTLLALLGSRALIFGKLVYMSCSCNGFYTGHSLQIQTNKISRAVRLRAERTIGKAENGAVLRWLLRFGKALSLKTTTKTECIFEKKKKQFVEKEKKNI